MARTRIALLLTAISSCPVVANASTLYTCYGELRLTGSPNVVKDKEVVVSRASSGKYQVSDLVAGGLLIETRTFVSAEEGIRHLQSLAKALKSFSGQGRVDPATEIKLDIRGCAATKLTYGIQTGGGPAGNSAGGVQ